MQAEPTPVAERDATTMEHLEAAERSILAACKAMPNHVESCFDPMRDAPRLDDALHLVRVTMMAWDDSGRPERVRSVCADCGAPTVAGGSHDCPDPWYRR